MRFVSRLSTTSYVHPCLGFSTLFSCCILCFTKTSLMFHLPICFPASAALLMSYFSAFWNWRSQTGPRTSSLWSTRQPGSGWRSWKAKAFHETCLAGLTPKRCVLCTIGTTCAPGMLKIPTFLLIYEYFRKNTLKSCFKSNNNSLKCSRNTINLGNALSFLQIMSPIQITCHSKKKHKPHCKNNNESSLI